MTGLAAESRGPIRIAIDAMGGENAPGVEVEGGLAAVRESGGAVEVVLVGREDLVGAELAKHDHEGLPVSVVNADEIIEMADSPASAVRRKRGASIVVATELHKRREVDGLVSAGNTGAVVASSLLGLGMLPNVRRPAIASLFPTAKKPAIVLDVGASIDSRPSDLLEFAAMGEVLARHLLSCERPRVALMNIGEEPTKGSQLTQEAYALLAASPLDFIGNVEGQNFLQGAADVVVCDGFVGNIVLKLAEGMKEMFLGALGALKGSGAEQNLSAFVSQFDYSEYGGAPLLGVAGVVIIAHGASSPKAIKNAVKVAARFVDTDMDSRIVDRLKEVGEPMANSLKRAYIAGVGMKVPDKIVTNEDFTKIVDTSDEWITQMTGIKERRYTEDDQATSDLAIPASEIALERAGVKGSDVDAIIVATATPDTPFPSTACLIQDAIGAREAFAYDIAAACAGFIFALAQGQSYLQTGMAETVLVVGAECLTKITNFTDRNSCVLFGDGAGAVVLKSCDPPRGIVDLFLRCDGSLSDYIIQRGGGSREPASHRTVDENLHTIQMKGRKVYVNASKAMADAVMLLLERQGLTGDDLDMLFPHQANIRIIQSVAEKAGMPMEKVFVNIHKYGNTSAASVPIALAEAYEQGLLEEGMLIGMVAFGSGFTWGSALIRW